MSHLPRVSLAVLGLGIFSLLTVGGCGGSAATGGGATATTGTTAASRGALSGVTAGLTSALTAATGQAGAGLKLKSQEDGELECVEGDDGSVECGDRDSEDTDGHVSCGFEDEGTAEECGEGSSIFSVSSDLDPPLTFENFHAGDECGQEVVLNGTVTGHIEASFNECTGAISVSATLETSDLTVTLEDGTTHEITFSLTFTFDGENESVSGQVCVDGECSDIDSMDDLETTECDAAEEEGCVEECVAEHCGSSEEATLEEESDASGEEASCEESCHSFCEDDTGEVEEPGEDCLGHCEGGCEGDEACMTECMTSCDDEGGECDVSIEGEEDAVSYLGSLDNPESQGTVDSAIAAGCSQSTTDLEAFMSGFLCSVGIDPAMASSPDLQNAVDNLENIDTSDLEGSCTAAGF